MTRDVLTKRECEVARCAAAGATSRQIADQLFINIRTVDSHLGSIYRKLGVANRAGLATLVAQGALDTAPPMGATGAPLGRLATPRSFVGRHDELEQILEMAQESQQHKSFRVVLVSGEPGIGKSSIVATALERLSERSAPTRLVGVCVEGLRSPYGAIVEALAPCLSDESVPLVDAVGPDGGVLATLLPSLAPRLPGEPRDLDPAARPRLVSNALRNVLVHQAGRGPVILVLEDLQWADHTGIDLLRALITSPPPVPLLIIGTYRTTALSPSDALGTFLADCAGAQHTERIELGGLDVTDAVELFEIMGGTGVSDGEIARLHDSTAGNSLYLSMMLRELVSGTVGAHLPHSVHDVVDHRIAALDTADRAVLEVAAIIGLDFDVDVLDRAVELLDPALATTVVSAIERCGKAGIINTSGDPEADFGFAHDIVRQAVLERVSPRRTARLHGAVGNVLATIGEDVPVRLPLIINHLSRSHRRDDNTMAIRFLLDLLDSDVAILALDENADLASQVLARLSQDSASDRARLAVLTRLIDVHYLRFDHAAHRKAVVDAVAIARRIGTPTDVAEVLTHYRLLPETGTTDTGILAMVDDAVGELDDAPGALRLRALLAGYAAYHRSIGGEGFTVVDAAAAALADARASGDQPTVGAVLYNLAAVLLGSPDVARMSAALDEFATHRGDIAGVVDRHDGLRLAACAALQTGDRTGFERLAARLANRAALSHSGFLSSVVQMWDAVSALLDGRLEDASQANDELYPMAAADPNVLLGWFVQMVGIRCAQGRLGEVLGLVDATLADHEDLAPLHALTSWCHFQAGNADRAWDVAEPLARSRFSTIRDDWTLAASVAWLTPTVTARGTTNHARLLAQRLAPYSGQLVLVGSASDVLGAADRSLALLALRADQDNKALELFERAETLEVRSRAVLHAASTRLEMIRLLSRIGDTSARKRSAEMLIELSAEADASGWVHLSQGCAAVV